ncbi:hypothetical protein Vafri_6425 [Volvox africanus]|uniref:AB hydrolase-1 domain-containing protein n=1 Tax=Volvox africanus TaxID=51714 RepID=A0A8J4AXX2_9CHLO|nr:hypothetical protein Vafri_6425 [Volvox africanus]
MAVPVREVLKEMEVESEGKTEREQHGLHGALPSPTLFSGSRLHSAVLTQIRNPWSSVWALHGRQGGAGAAAAGGSSPRRRHRPRCCSCRSNPTAVAVAANRTTASTAPRCDGVGVIGCRHADHRVRCWCSGGMVYAASPAVGLGLAAGAGGGRTGRRDGHITGIKRRARPHKDSWVPLTGFVAFPTVVLAVLPELATSKAADRIQSARASPYPSSHTPRPSIRNASFTPHQSVPLPIPSRAWLLRHLRDRGLSDALANWLASNLVHVPAPAAAHYQHSASMSSGHSGPSLHSHNHETLHHPYQHHCEDQQQQHRRHGTRIHDGLRPQQQQKGAGSSGLHGGGGSDIGSGSGGPFAWSFDIQCAGAMYMSYRTSEYWQVLEKPPHGTAVHLVQGARSDRWPEAMQRRLNQAAAAAAATGAPPLGSEGGSFDHHVLERAGHWLHVDNPEGLLRLVLPHLAGL